MAKEARVAAAAELGLIMGGVARADQAHVDGDIDRAKRIINDLVLDIHARMTLIKLAPEPNETAGLETGSPIIS